MGQRHLNEEFNSFNLFYKIFRYIGPTSSFCLKRSLKCNRIFCRSEIVSQVWGLKWLGSLFVCLKKRGACGFHLESLMKARRWQIKAWVEAKGNFINSVWNRDLSCKRGSPLSLPNKNPWKCNEAWAVIWLEFSLCCAVLLVTLFFFWVRSLLAASACLYRFLSLSRADT